MIYILQNHIRIMPTTLVASILLMYRKGISEANLVEKASWLGMALNQRGAVVATDGGLPHQNTVQLGLKHLEDYIIHKRNIYKPKVAENGYQNYIMLGYYRNTLNFVFFNEAMILCSLQSQGVQVAWKDGMPINELFKRSVYLSEVLKREEVLKDRITLKTRDYFDSLITFMQ